VQEAAPAIGLQIQILKATTISEIDAVFAAIARERLDALFVGPDGFFTSRHGQFATLTARDSIPAAYARREFATAGGLMSYGTDLADAFHQVGVYTVLSFDFTHPENNHTAVNKPMPAQRFFIVAALAI
jgi:putative ABC transport system substrate-binding protein